MAEYTYQLKGWQAVAAVVALAAFTGGRMYFRVRPVDDGVREAVRARLLNEYSGRGPKDVTRILAEAREGKPVEELQPVAQRDVEFTSIAAHGRMGGMYTVVRAEVTVDGGPPPDGRAVRYFSIMEKLGGGWMVVGESDSYRYYEELVRSVQNPAAVPQ
jgi:hypothetical protein